MVQVTTSQRPDAYKPDEGWESASSGQGTPQIHVHHVERYIHGNGVCIKSYGEIKIAAGEYVWAWELKMNTLQELQLTAEVGRNDGHGYIPQKSIWHKGEYDNYASIDVFDDAAEFQGPGTGPVDGSIWLNYEALGE